MWSSRAVILLDVELQAAHRRPMISKPRLGSGRVYRAEKTVTLCRTCGTTSRFCSPFREALVQELQNIS